MGWEQGSGVARQRWIGHVVVAIGGIATALCGYASDKAAEDRRSATDVVAVAEDAGAHLEEWTYLSAPGSVEVRSAVEGASWSHEVSVAGPSTTNYADLYEISASATEDVACLAVWSVKPQTDEFARFIEVSASAASGPC